MMKMLQVNLLITSLCCLTFFSNLAQCSTESSRNIKEALITNISRIPAKVVEHGLTKNRGTQERPNSKKLLLLRKGLPSNLEHHAVDENYKPDKTLPQSGAILKALPKNSHALNKKLLRKMGFTKVKAPNSHHRKRLAVESRRHSSPDDSHMFIIKLPPNFTYYTNPKSEAKSNAITASNTEKANVAKFPFNSNGKPGRIYHWNLPVLHKILEKKKLSSQAGLSGKKSIFNLQNIAAIQKPWENDIEKSYKSNYKKSLKYKSPSYYAPTNAVHKKSFNRYFPGNGKPKGFYIIKENQKRKNMYYKDIVP